MPLNINSQKEFFEEVSLTDDGRVEMESVSQVGVAAPAKNQYDFFNKIKLNDNGSISVVITNL
jgi:hypothetical protein